jgi:hypothetical protein
MQEPGFYLARRYSQGGHGLGGREADGKSVLPATTDYGALIANFSDPNHALRIYKHFLTLHIFKHDELHVSPPHFQPGGSKLATK